jgi:hypothetical protein
MMLLTFRRTWIAAIGSILLASCQSAANPASPAPRPTAIEATPSLNAPPALLPAGAEAEFRTDFSRHSVDFGEILSGGPPKNGIPAIDDPAYVSVDEAEEWLAPQEPVIVVEVGDQARAYPIQILTWHEIVNDQLGGLPLAVTFCPLCNTGIAFERTLEGQVLDFGTTGRLRFSNLIMYDRQTESWWQQATGEAIVGEHTGKRLRLYPATMIAWSEFAAAYPEGTVLTRDTGYDRNYGRNPYIGYDDITRSPFLYEGRPTPDGMPAMARVFTIDQPGEAVAYPYAWLEQARVVHDRVGDQPVVVFWQPGTASALDGAFVSTGREVGAAAAYLPEHAGQPLTFEWAANQIRDQETGSVWNALGVALSGPLAGARLQPIVGVNHFWFSWAAFRPDTRIYGG